MSLASHAVAFLNEQYRIVLWRMGKLQWLAERGAVPLRKTAASRWASQPMQIDALEQRQMLSAAMVGDINITEAPSLVPPIAMGANLYFVNGDDDHGLELWKSDGTADGTVLVKDIFVGSGSSNPANLTNVNGTLYFQARNAFSGLELWKSDGTAAGTVLVKDIIAGSGSSAPSHMADVNGILYFQAYIASGGTGLWRSDGTAAGTVLVKDFGNAANAPFHLTNVNGTLYFVAPNGATGLELWKSDGTAAGTVLVKDINPGNANSDPQYLTNVNGTLYFRANNGSNGDELWRSDGTAAGTVLVKDIFLGSDGSNPYWLTNVNGTLYFQSKTASNGTELWKSDGTAAGTVLVKDISPGSEGSYPCYLTNVNNALYFQATNGSNGTELWKSDGTAVGTVLVNDIYPGGSSGPRWFTNVNGMLYFVARNAANGRELWKSDGTAAGTVLVKETNPDGDGADPYYLVNVNGTLCFRVYDAVNGCELWKSDGTAAGTVLVKDLNPSDADSDPGCLTNVNGTLYFRATNGSNGYELWKSDGTVGGTVLIKDISPGITGSYPDYFTIVNGTLYFVADDAVNGCELWKSDGTAAGTVLVADINPGSDGSYPYDLVDVNGTLYFVAYDAVNGCALWKSDGTAAGTVLVKFTNPGGDGSYDLTNVNSTLYFREYDAVNGYELWKSDGTWEGTVLVKGTNGSDPGDLTNLTNVNGTLYFRAYDAVNGYELWKSDGTAAGTVLVRDINPGADGSDPGDLTNVNGTLYFLANDGSSWYELWKSDGTAAGTVLVKDINPGGGVSDLRGLTNVNGTLYFGASDGANGRELWRSDGTAVGTVLVKDIYSSGNGGSDPGSFTNMNGTLYFVAQTAVAGRELWKSDGTAVGTVLVRDINPGSDSSWPGSFTDVNGSLYFVASDGFHGSELWVIRPPVAIAGSYSVDEGGTVELSASGSSDPDPAETLTFSWDLDGDGIFGETGAAAGRGDEVGETPTFSAAGLDGPSTFTIQLRATNSVGFIGVDSGSVATTSVAPVALLSNDGPASHGHAVTVSFGDAQDPSTADMAAGLHYSYALDVEDLAGSYAEATDGASRSFTFAAKGQYTVYGRIFDKDGAYTDHQTTVHIAEVAYMANNGVADYNVVAMTSTGYVAARDATGAVALYNNPYVSVPASAAIAIWSSDAEGNPSGEVTFLDCSCNQLTSLDVSGNAALTELNCSCNQLTALDVSGNTALTQLGCYSNQLTTLDVSGNTLLQHLFCSANHLTALDVSRNADLQYLDCQRNQLTALNVTGSMALQYLSCYGNHLPALDVSGNISLQYIECYSNQLAALDVSGDAALQYLDCSGSQLTALDVRGCAALQQLFCNSNPLASINIAGCTQLPLPSTDWSTSFVTDAGVNVFSDWAPLATVMLNTATPGTGDVLTATATKSDPDEDPVSLRFVWKVDGVTKRTFTTSTELTDSLDLTVEGNGDKGQLITVDVTPSDGTLEGETISASATVGNSAAAIAIDEYADASEGEAWLATGSFSDLDEDAWSATVSYGDGTATEPLTLNGDKTFALSHVYQDSGDYTVQVVLSDGTSSVAHSIVVHATNTAPIANFTSTGDTTEGGSVAVAFPETYDPSSSDTSAGFRYSFALDPEDLATSYSTAGTDASATFSFADDGIYTIYGRILDKDGGYTDYARPVDVANVAPSLLIGGAPQADVGRPYTLYLASSDIGPDAVTSWTINWGDGSDPDGDQIEGEIVTGNPESVTHVFVGAGPVTISAQATDEDGTWLAANTLTVELPLTAPSGLAISQLNCDSLTLTWQDQSNCEGGYLVEQLVEGQWILLAAVTPDGTEAIISGLNLEPSSSYTFHVLAFDLLGHYSAAAEITADTPPLPHAPVIVADAISSSSIRIAWQSVAGASGYSVSRSTDDGVTWEAPILIDAAAVEYVDENLLEGARCSYQMRTIGAVGDSSLSVMASAKTLSAAPSELVAVSTRPGRVKLRWKDNSASETGFTVRASTDQGATWTTLAVLPANSTTFSADGLGLDGPTTIMVSAAGSDGDPVTDGAVSDAIALVPFDGDASIATVVSEGSQYTLPLTSAGSLGYWAIDWGDGSAIESSAGGTSVTHVYADGPATHSLTVHLTGSDGTELLADSLEVLVLDVAPTLQISGDARVVEGQPYTLNLSKDDPGDDTITGWTIDWGEGGDPEVFAGNPELVQHEFGAGAVRETIIATASDEDGIYVTVPLPVCFVPIAPTDCTASPTSRSGEMLVTWLDRSAVETAYQIERSTDGINFGPVALVEADATTCLVTGLLPGETYTFRVIAVRSDASGNRAFSFPVSAPAVFLPLPAPRSVYTRVSGLSGDRAGVIVDWEESVGPFDSYRLTVVREGQVIEERTTTWAGGEQLYLEPGSYEFRVAIRKGAFQSDYASTELQLPTCAQPTELVVMQHGYNLWFTWKSTNWDYAWLDAIQYSFDGSNFQTLQWAHQVQSGNEVIRSAVYDMKPWEDFEGAVFVLRERHHTARSPWSAPAVCTVLTKQDGATENGAAPSIRPPAYDEGLWQLSRDGVALATVRGGEGADPYIDTGAEAGHHYQYTFSSLTYPGTSYSWELYTQPADLIAAPATEYCGVTLTWSATEDAEYYLVEHFYFGEWEPYAFVDGSPELDQFSISVPGEPSFIAPTPWRVVPGGAGAYGCSTTPVESASNSDAAMQLQLTSLDQTGFDVSWSGVPADTRRLFLEICGYTEDYCIQLDPGVTHYRFDRLSPAGDDDTDHEEWYAWLWAYGTDSYAYAFADEIMVVPTLPEPQAFVAAPVSTSAINLSWDAVSGATSYELVTSTDGVTWDALAEVEGTTYAVTGLDPGRTYLFQLRARGVLAYSKHTMLRCATLSLARGPIRTSSEFFAERLPWQWYDSYEDTSTPSAVSLNFVEPLRFMGSEWSDVFVNENGSVSFGEALSDHVPSQLDLPNTIVITPLFADVNRDYWAAGDVSYGTGTIDGHRAFAATWSNVQCWPSYEWDRWQRGFAAPTNDFQLVLIERADRGAGDFDIELNYGHVRWESSGSGSQGLGGDTARAGWSSGSGATGSWFEFDGSGQAGGLLDSNPLTGLAVTSTNSDVMGRHVFEIRNSPDLDVDSDNDNGLSEPGRTDEEEQLEDASGRAGKQLPLSTGDSDKDKVPDFADGYGAWPESEYAQSAGLKFTPMVLELPKGADPANTTITFTYDASDPTPGTDPETNVTRTGAGSDVDPYVYTSASGHLRIWLKDGSQERVLADYLTPDTPYNAADLGFTGGNSITVWVEAVRFVLPAADGSGHLPITVTVSKANGPTYGSDTVRVTTGGVYLNIDSDNTSAGRPEMDAGEQQAHYDDKGPGKIVVVNNADRDRDGIVDWADLGSGANATQTLVPLIVKVPEWLASQEALDAARIRFIYSGSSPADLTGPVDGGYLLPAGSLRLWRGTSLGAREATQYVVSGQSYSFADLELDTQTQTATLWIEAVRPSASLGDLSVELQLEPSGSAGFSTLDKVRLTALSVLPNAEVSDGVRLIDGGVVTSDVDIASSAYGMPWVQGRTFSSDLVYWLSNLGGGGVELTQFPHLIQATSSIIAIIGSRLEVFDRINAHDGARPVAPIYQPRGSSLTQLHYDAGQYVLTLADGGEYYFNEFDPSLPEQARGRFVKYVSPGGKETTSHQREDGLIDTITREQVTYAYEWQDIGGQPRLTSVEMRHGGATASRAVYTYCDADDAWGNEGDLKQVLIYNAAGTLVETKYFRYAKVAGASGQMPTVDSRLILTLSTAGYARLNPGTQDIDSFSSAALMPYADDIFTYALSGRVVEHHVQGIGGTGANGSALGKITYAYSVPASSAYGINVNESVVTESRGQATTTAYLNYLGQPIRTALSADGSSEWNTFIVYDEAGRVWKETAPSGLQTIWLYNGVGLIESQSVTNGSSSAHVQRYTYRSQSAAGVTIYLPESLTLGDSDAQQLYSYSYASWSRFQPLERTTTLPASAALYGHSGGASTCETYDEYGRMLTSMDADGYTEEFQYDDLTGAMKYHKDGAGRETRWTGFDAFGRATTVTASNGATTVYSYEDGILESSIGTASDDAPATATVVDHRTGTVSEYIQTANGSEALVARTLGDLAGRTLQQTRHPDGVGGISYTTTYQYDDQGRLSQTTDGSGYVTRLEYDKLGRVTKKYGGQNEPSQALEEYVYDGDGVGDGNLTKLTQYVGATEQRFTSYQYDWRDRQERAFTWSSKDSLSSEVSYEEIDSLGQVKREVRKLDNAIVSTTTRTFDGRGQVAMETITPASTPSRSTQFFYDGRGNLTKTVAQNGLTTTTLYDGAGRVKEEALGDGTVNAQEVETIYGEAGRYVITKTTERASTAPDRVSYVVEQFDRAGHTTVAINYGACGAQPDGNAVPGRSNVVEVSTSTYRNGWHESTTDARGVKTLYGYDALGRLTSENTSGLRITSYYYDGLDRQTAMVAVSNTTGSAIPQVTTHKYIGRDTMRVYTPDYLPSNPASRPEEYHYNLLGQVTVKHDMAGVTHEYTYDGLGRLTSDAVTGTLPAAIDGTVRELRYDYDGWGYQSVFKSLGAGLELNEVARTHNGFGEIVAETTTVGGTSSTVSYNRYPDGTLTSMAYPGGRTVTYGYEGNLDYVLGRATGISHGGEALETYAYVGLGGLQSVTRPQPGLTLTLGYDQLGRTRDATWNKGPVEVDRYSYRYDAAGNMTARANVTRLAANQAGWGQSVHYNALGYADGLWKGALVLTATDSVRTGTPVLNEVWRLDAWGNRSGTLPGSDAAGRASEYDAASTDQSMTYDAWGRLVGTADTEHGANTTFTTYTLDALGRRIGEVQQYARAESLGTHRYRTQKTFVNDLWGNVLAEHTVAGRSVQASGMPEPEMSLSESSGCEYVWGVNGLIVRYSGTDLAWRTYALADGRGNITALTDASGVVVERFDMDPFGGSVQAYTATWAAQVVTLDELDVVDNLLTQRATGSGLAWEYYGAAGRYDRITGLYHANAGGDYNPKANRTVQANLAAMSVYDSGEVRLHGWLWGSMGALQTAGAATLGAGLILTPAAPLVMAVGAGYLGYQSYQGYTEYGGIGGSVAKMSGVADIYEGWFNRQWHTGAELNLGADTRTAMFTGGALQLAFTSYAGLRLSGRAAALGIDAMSTFANAFGVRAARTGHVILPRSRTAVSKGALKEFDIVRYDAESPGFEKHHGVLDIWASENIEGYPRRGPGTLSVLLGEAGHAETKAVYRQWLTETTGKPVGGAVNWKEIPYGEMLKLSERMFDAARVPAQVRSQYYRAFAEQVLRGW